MLMKKEGMESIPKIRLGMLPNYNLLPLLKSTQLS